MAIGSGAGASFGVKTETTWGTYAAPTAFLPADSFNLSFKRTSVPMTGVAAGRIAPPDEVETLTWGEGAVEAQVLRTSFGPLFQALCGGTVTPVQQAATTAYLQTHPLGADNRGKGLTLQKGVPNLAGTANPFTGYGMKPTGATFSCAKGEALKMSMDFWGKKVDQAQTLSAPGYTATQSSLPFNWSQMAVKLGTFGAEASVADSIKSVSITMARGMNTDDAFYAGNTGAPSEPVYASSDIMSLFPVTGTLEVDLATKADFVDRWLGFSSTSLVWEFVGPIIASTYAYTFRITLPKIRFDDATPGVSGASVNSFSVPFHALLDVTNGYGSLTYLSTDTTIA